MCLSLIFFCVLDKGLGTTQPHDSLEPQLYKFFKGFFAPLFAAKISFSANL